MDLGHLNTRIAHTIISAAILDDVFSLILLAVMISIIGTWVSPDAARIAQLCGEALLLFGVAILFGMTVYPLGGRLVKSFRSDEIDFTALLVVVFAYALLAEQLELHFVLGSFLAGLFFVSRTIDPVVYEAVKARASGITMGFLAPIFSPPSACISIPARCRPFPNSSPCWCSRRSSARSSAPRCRGARARLHSTRGGRGGCRHERPRCSGTDRR